MEAVARRRAELKQGELQLGTSKADAPVVTPDAASKRDIWLQMH